MNTQAGTNIHDAIGGVPAVRQLAQRFYELMDELPEAYNVRKIHPEDLRGAANTLFEYLSGWLGGPPLYTQKHGHPMLRGRHFPYKIGPIERNEWLLCMRLALAEVVADPALREGLMSAFTQLGDHMINTTDVTTCVTATH